MPLFFSNWSIVDLQCHISFKCTAVLYSYTCIFFQIIFHYRLLQDIKDRFLCCIIGPCYLSSFYIVVYVKLLQLCPTLFDPPGFSVHGILQTRILEWVAMPCLQDIFLTQGLNPRLLCLLHWQAGSLPLVPPGKHVSVNPKFLICPFTLSLRITIHLLTMSVRANAFLKSQETKLPWLSSG